jgi:imidazole glycerol-phosphate synthase subunit HisF
VLKKRLIFTLLVDNQAFQLSRNFSLQKVGDLHWLFNRYNAESILHSIDELVVLNVGKKEKNTDSFIELLEQLSQKCFMPITSGGGIYNIDDAKKIFRAGADKVILNTALFSNTELIKDIATIYGNQSVVASIDYRIINDNPVIFTNNGQNKVNIAFDDMLSNISKMCIGELYLTSIDQDGTGRGYDINTLKRVAAILDIPIIASGGVGKFEHLQEGIMLEGVTGVSTSNLFNFIGNGLKLAREFLTKNHVKMATWDYKELEGLVNV